MMTVYVRIMILWLQLFLLLLLHLGWPSLAAAAAETGKPYLENGKICEERSETVERMEYDEQIHCTVAMEEKCDKNNSGEGGEEEEVEEDEACHTMFKKECMISYRPRATRVRVKVCPDGRVSLAEDGDEGKKNDGGGGINSVVMDIRPSVDGEKRSGCINGRVRICVKKYETECKTEYIKHRWV